MSPSRSSFATALRSLLAVVCLAVGAGVANAQDVVPENPFPNRVTAVELDGGVEWLNAAGPISLKDLRGKVVLLDFWTYCCINCIHVLPDLKYLEEKYPNELVVIGVHSAKFDNEKETGNIRKAILRYEIAHPVVNDAEMVLWRKFGVRSWPTLVLIDPEGYYCGFISGEGNREILDKVIERVIAYHRSKKTLDETPVRFDLERFKQPPTPLRFPGKLLADVATDRLFISDSNHNRIVVTKLNGELVDVIGQGTIGRADGEYATSQFDHPQGMALVGQKLYVADTENHLIRVIDLQARTVRTLAGTGEQGNIRTGSKKLLEMPLNSPWDLLHLDGVLYIAMAGPHQIWSHKLGENAIQPYAGTGREDITNGPLGKSALAQPSGLATDGKFIYVCDSEGSSIRKISTRAGQNLRMPVGTVGTIVGTSDLPNGRALFEFGDVDGIGDKARLQHPLGIAFDNGQLYVADTYNHKIKQIDLATNACLTWLASFPNASDVTPPRFNEPAGLAIANGKMYVADTNNNRICVVDMATKGVSVLEIPGLAPPASTAPRDDDPEVPSQKLEPQRVAAADGVAFEVAFSLPAGHKLNPMSSVTYRVTAAGEQSLIAADNLNVRDEATIDGELVRFQVPVRAQAGAATIDVVVNYTYCRDTASGLCKLGTARWTIPLEVAADATSKVIKLTTTP